MKHVFLSAVMAISFFGSTANAQTLTVVPTIFAAAEGNSSSSSLSQAGAASMQTYFSETFLTAAGITPGVVIDGLALRRNAGGATGPPADTIFSNYNIFLSPSFGTPGELTNTFANNIIGTQSLVRTGPLTFAANSMPGGATPNAFGTMIDFSTPYTYNGGSLLFEFRRGPRSGDLTTFNTDIDNTATMQAGARWLFNTTSDAALTGTLSNGGHIFQLRITPVPEPTSIVLVSLAGTMGLWRWRRQSTQSRSSD